jgi:O-succinylbenzoic acid--CoA ligase
LERLVGDLCGWLQTAGIQPGQRVAALLPNGLRYVVLIHALIRLKATLVPLNGRLTAVEWGYQLEQAAVHWLIYDEEMAGATDNLPPECQPLLLTADRRPQTAAAFDTNRGRPSAVGGQDLDWVQAIVFTSGTSGRPKGAQITLANHYHSALASAERLGVQPGDLWLSCLPLYHVGGLAVILRSWLYSTAVDLHPRFDLEQINQSLDTKPITLISLVPTMLQRLVNGREHWPASLRLILLGGAAAEPELMKRANEMPRKGVGSGKWEVRSGQSSIVHRPLVAPTYGLTEAASQAATMPPEEAARKPGSVGKPLRGTEVRIVDDQGQDLPPGEIGEIVVTGPTVSPGYFEKTKEEGRRQKEEQSSSFFLRPSSFATGDLGYLDADGDLWLVQRRSDLIVSGGENVYPAEVEGALRGHPAVEAVCVVGVADAEWGQRVAALVVRCGEVTAEELIEYGRDHLAGYKLPRLIQFVPELPLTASGKVARQTAREWLEAAVHQRTVFAV